MKSFLQIMGVCSAILLLIAGFQLISIESISGDSIAESFYHGVGWMSFGIALLSGGLLIGLSGKFEHNLQVKNSPNKNEEVEIEQVETVTSGSIAGDMVKDIKRIFSSK